MGTHADAEFYVKYGFCRENKAGEWCPECERLDAEEKETDNYDPLRLVTQAIAAAMSDEGEFRD